MIRWIRKYHSLNYSRRDNISIGQKQFQWFHKAHFRHHSLQLTFKWKQLNDFQKEKYLLLKIFKNKMDEYNSVRHPHDFVCHGPQNSFQLVNLIGD